MVAPVLPYGITGRMDGFTISDAGYRPFVTEIVKGLARDGFKNIILINGHGGNTVGLGAIGRTGGPLN